MILAIDPGPVESAYVLWDGERIAEFGKILNSEMAWKCSSSALIRDCRCVLEMIACYGMPVGSETFETCVWIGRFIEVFGPERCDRVTRNVVKNHLCHSSRANDANIRQAILDRFGGKEKAIGKKATPGPLYGLAGDVWAAFAVALTWSDQAEARRIA